MKPHVANENRFNLVNVYERPTMLSLLQCFVILFIVLLCYHMWKINTRLFKMVENWYPLPGPKYYPIIGNMHLFSSDTLHNYKVVFNLGQMYKRIYRIWMGSSCYAFFYDPLDAEVLLTSNSQITKADGYTYTEPWIKTGLLTSTGAKWKSRRRIITPTFHFQILDTFMETFESNVKIFLNKILEKADKDAFDVYPYVGLMALDTICETSFGRTVNAQSDATSSYVWAVKQMCKITIIRTYQPLLANDFTFNLSKWGPIQKKALNIIHTMANEIIVERRKFVESQGPDPPESEDGRKKKYPFLDLLLRSAEAAQLTNEDLQEEVNTFIFEGHDTITSGISFAMYCLSQNPSVQERVYQEQIDIFGDSDRPITCADCQEMKYLERVLKESLRLYPSVPIYGRQLTDDVKLRDGLILPKGMQVYLVATLLHRNPGYWDNPEEFNPDNFLPEKVASRNTFAYVPFSAGPRNCIGQKYAMLMMKVCISLLIRKIELLPCAGEEKAIPKAEVVLIPHNGINLKVIKRK